jgi:hypothetical protein
MNRLLIMCLLLSFVCDAKSEEERYRFPKEAATWKVSCQKLGSRGSSDAAEPVLGAAPNTKEVEVAQDENTRRSIVKSTDGKSREVWSVPKLGIVLAEDPMGTPLMTNDDATLGDPFGPLNFEWIKTAALVSPEPVRYENIPCFHYKGTLLLGRLTGDPIKIPCEAWIDAETRLPVALQKADLVGRFTFGGPPASLEMPKKFQKRIDYYKIAVGIR